MRFLPDETVGVEGPDRLAPEPDDLSNGRLDELLEEGTLEETRERLGVVRDRGAFENLRASVSIFCTSLEIR